MTEITFNYNPYTKEKIFNVDGCRTLEFDKIFDSDKELMEFPEFFDTLYKRLNDSFSLIFSGIERDWDFLEDSLRVASCRDRIDLRKGKVIKVADSIGRLKELFEKMQRETPFEELKNEKIKDVFNRAVNNEFEIAVVATVSSGKSTLINAMLGQELLPARNEATTATVARILDCDGMKSFEGKSYDSQGNELMSCSPLNKENMEFLNNDERTACIEIKGDIVGIESKNLQLVLNDTPGTNNSRTVEHYHRTMKLLNNHYKPVILYILNASQLAINDDALLLKEVSKIMSEGGRQSRDRFLFVLNKADQFDPDKSENEKVDKKIEQLKSYLEGFGIRKPRIFPCSAFFAKLIRQQQQNVPMTIYEEAELQSKKLLFLKDSRRHFCDHAPVSREIRCKQNKMLEKAIQDDNVNEQVLIYTGLPSIELTISEYLDKYAVPMKITEGVASFLEYIKKERVQIAHDEQIAEDEKRRDELIEQLNLISGDIDKGEIAQKLRIKVSEISADAMIQERWNSNFAISSATINDLRDSISPLDEEGNPALISITEAEKKISDLISGITEVTTMYRIDLEESINKIAREKAVELKKDYDKYLKELIGGSFDEDIDPAEIIGSLSFLAVEDLVDCKNYSTQLEEKKWVVNTDKKWYKPWTWFDASGYWKTEYKDVVNFEEIYTKEIQPRLDDFYLNARKIFSEEVFERIEHLKNQFSEYFDTLNNQIQEKILNYKECLTNKEELDKRIKIQRERKNWLENFMQEIESLLDI